MLHRNDRISSIRGRGCRKMVMTEWRKIDEREAVEKGTSRNRRCDVSDTSSIPSPPRFFRRINCCRDATFSSLKWYYTCSWKRGGQFTCGVADAIMKREEGRQGKMEGTGHYGISLIASNRLIRAQFCGAVDGGTYSRAESRLFDRFNYTRGPGTRKPRANWIFCAILSWTFSRLWMLRFSGAASQSSFFTNFLNRPPEYLINRALQMIFKPPCNDQRLCEVINI